MKIEGSDLRVRMTKRMLIDAFLQLRREKPLRRITVSEVLAYLGCWVWLTLAIRN